MRNKIIMIIVWLATTQAILCQYYDYQWGFGYDDGVENGFGMNIFDWNEGIFEIKDGGGFVLSTDPNDTRYGVGRSGACIADREGKLALLTNNCHIIGADTDTITNGSNIYLSEDAEESCFDFGIGGLTHCTAFLPNRSNDSITYLIHRTNQIVYTDTSGYNTADSLYMTTIKQQPDGNYSVTQKNKKILELPSIRGRVMGIPTEDEQGWWVFTIERFTNTFYSQLIDDKGNVSEPVISSVGPEIHPYSLGNWTINIANDGRSVAMSHRELGTLLYDFDRLTGKFSNFRALPTYGPMCDGFCWSPSNRFLYVAEGRIIVQYDMAAQTAHRDSVHIVDVNGLTDIYTWPVSLGNMFLGPDCRIYVSSGAGSAGFHVIHYPDKKGKACTVQTNIPVPYRFLWIFPTITKYRMGAAKAEVCDSTIAWMGPIPSSVQESIATQEQLSIYPNPSHGQIYMGLHGRTDFDHISIVNAIGETVYTSTQPWRGEGFINLEQIDKGLYFVIAIRDNVAYRGRFVKE